MKKVTMYDVAQKSGYTLATVSRALNHNPIVNIHTREKIFEVAREIGYISQQNSSSQSKTLPTIGVIIPDINNPYFPPLLKGIQDQLTEEGLSMIICNSNSSSQIETECIKTLISAKVKGVIIDPLSDSSFKKFHHLSYKLPIVFTSNAPQGSHINCVGIDNYAASQIAVNYLISLGHTSIAYIHGNEDAAAYRLRLSGYYDTLKQHFININKKMVCKVHPDRLSGFRATKKIFGMNLRPTAFFASNDSLALGVLEFLKKYHFNIPQDISVIGIDNIEYASFPGIELTTVEEARYILGQTAASSILKLLHCTTENTCPAEPIQIIIPPKLIIRNTCGKIYL